MKLSSQKLVGILAVTGWLLSGFLFFSNKQSSDSESDGGGGKSNVSSSRAKTASHEAGSGKTIAKLLTTERSASLFARLEDIAASGKKGEVNQKLINACVETLSENNDITRSRDFSILMEMMRPEDAVAVHETFLKLHREGRGYSTEYYYFAQKWGEVDGSGALNYLTNQKPVRFTNDDYVNVMMGWSMHDPKAALDWQKNNPELADAHGGTLPILQGWLRNNPEEATDFILKNPVAISEKVRAITYASEHKLFRESMDNATDWLAALPTENDGILGIAAAEGWNQANIQFSELTYDNAARIFAKVGDKSWMNFDQFRYFADRTKFARENELSSNTFLQSLEKSWSSDKASAKFITWHQQNPDEVNQWLKDHEAEPFAQKMKQAIEADKK